MPELKVVLSVLKLVFSKDVMMKSKELLEELKPHSEKPEIRWLIRATWLYLAYSARHAERNYKALFDTVKNVVEKEKKMPSLYDLWKREGLAEGKAEGKAEAVLTFLQARFKKVPTSIEKMIRKVSDPVALDSWIANAATCSSLNEFKKAIS